ncbi:MAG: DUF418 domain-containing protein [Moraxella sp.]|uniref:DUF418 domain-containing protein n=1 Tax=Moraxella sp. TaxID=479 RepID=UPI0026DB0649|nr:DUF418 domain-containing protein [Moraxella sp.]MDO4450414.1 DUF418 domain-containing protein [Moraxella sp.]
MSKPPTQIPTTQAPITQPKDRLAILDSIRGFAIFGILVVNMMAFALPKHDLNLMNFTSTAWYDSIAMWFSTHFFEGKFYILFSFLFGIGFSVQLESAIKKGVNLWSFYPRRLLILFVIGVLHAYFWWGDVLRLYAILGLGLLLLKDLSIKYLLILAGLFLGLSGLVSAFPYIFGEFDSPNADDVWRSLLFSLIQMAPTAFALFLLGRVVGKLNFFNQLKNKVSLLKSFIIIAFIIWAVLKLALYLWVEPYSTIETLPKTLNDMAFTAIYMGILCLLSVNDKIAHYLNPLAKVGQMALTNYVMHTLMCVLFFKLAGLTGQLQMGALFLLSVGIFAIQLMYSHYWLKWFNYGLLEWVWRSLTFGKVQKLVK